MHERNTQISQPSAKPENSDSLNTSDRPQPGVVIGPITTALGDLRVTNDDIAPRFGTTPNAIFRKIGIESRPRASADVWPKDLAMQAARPLIKDPAFDPAALSLIIVATSCVAQTCPPLGCEILAMIQREHPQTPNVPAFDITATCAGWLYALKIAGEHLVFAPPGASVIIVTTEVISKGIADDDLAMEITFGDAATATLVWATAPPGCAGILPASASESESKTDNDNDDKPYLAMNPPLTFAAADNEDAILGPPMRAGLMMKMDGRAMRKNSLPAMAHALRTALDASGLSTGQLDKILPHQNNTRMINDLAAELGVAPEKMAINLRHIGNTSSNSLPLLVNDLRKRKTLTTGERIAFTTFGGGFTYAAATAKVL